MQAISLKTRIIILLVIFTFLALAIFVGIQLNHELRLIVNYLALSAQESARQIEEELKIKVLESPLKWEEKLRLVGTMLRSLKENNSIYMAYLFDAQGEILSSTEPYLVGDTIGYTDLKILDEVFSQEKQNRYVLVDKAQRLLFVYLFFSEKDQPDFGLKIAFPLGDIWTAFGKVYQPAMLVGIGVILVNIFLGVALARLIIGPIKVFNLAAKKIAAGQLDLRVDISTGDELEELAQTFNIMSQELVKMKERAENANPLTKLPGNVVIREEVEKRIKAGKRFTVIYSDLDNFKSFNDKYGIARGDEVIKLTAEIMRQALKEKGRGQDFLGHEGGDDFILLTTPEEAHAIADFIIKEFDRRVRSLYSQEDLEKGGIVSTARDGSIKFFPIMTISLMGVSNVVRELRSYAEATNIAVELKKKAKQEPISCFVLDRRKG